jgi:anti-anti-sigma factor
LLVHLVPELAVTIETVADREPANERVVVVTVKGELDLATEAALAIHLHEALNALPTSCAVVIDLAGVRFLGVPGIRTLLAFATELTERGIGARFLFPPRLKRIMIRLGLAQELARLG